MGGIRPRAAGRRAATALSRALLGLALLAGPVAIARGAELIGQDLADMDLEELMELEVTSVGKRAQKISHAPAAVTVLTSEDIRRSGMLTLPELLRMVPGLHVAQIDASHWSISSRGFGDEFSNKLLVLIDGRTIYEPIFSGVLWSQHDVMLEDIERIEVIRGPGGTLWGANAVNGVINIITKSAEQTQGLLTSVQAGSHEVVDGAARYGLALGEDVHARFYGKYADRREFNDPANGSADDDWESIRAGGRIDWDATDATLVTLQGDWFESDADRLLAAGLQSDEDNHGGNVLLRATHTFSPTQALSLQGYYDRSDRNSFVISEERDTFDVELQHSFAPWARHQVVWGAGYRSNRSDVEGSSIGPIPILTFDPEHRRDDLWSLFLQNDFTVVEDLVTLSLGTKLEHNDYSGWEVQPSGRVLVTPSDRHSFWAAISRAVRSPSRVEDDVVFLQPTGLTTYFLATGDSDVESEDVLAYELGFRTRPIDPLTFDVAAYYNDYDDLRSTESAGPPIPNFPFPGATTTPLVIANGVDGRGYGVELTGTWSVTSYWRLIGSYTYMNLDLDADSPEAAAGAEDLEDLAPRHQFQIRSNLNLPWSVAFDTMLYWVDGLPDQGVHSYVRVDTRLAWTPIENLELSVAGLNLAEPHREFPNGLLTQASQVPRSVYGSVRWSFR